jgi:lysophospholipase L1-like esterase
MARRWTWLAAAPLLIAGCATAAGKGPNIESAPTTASSTSVVQLTQPTTAGVTDTPVLSEAAPARPNVTDNRVYLIGDSIAESAGPRYSGTLCDALEPLGWDVVVDAVTGRNTGQAVQSLRAHRSSLGQVLVVLIGHNDSIDPEAYRENLTRLLASAPDVRWILLLTNYEFERGRNRMNLILYALASTDDRIQVVDWNRVVEDTKGAIRGDGLHLTSVGEKALAETVAGALGPAPAVDGNRRACISFRSPRPRTGQSSGRSSTTVDSSSGTDPTTSASSGASTGAPATDPPAVTDAPSTDAPTAAPPTSAAAHDPPSGTSPTS